MKEQKLLKYSRFPVFVRDHRDVYNRQMVLIHDDAENWLLALYKKEAAALIPILQRFVETGSIEEKS